MTALLWPKTYSERILHPSHHTRLRCPSRLYNTLQKTRKFKKMFQKSIMTISESCDTLSPVFSQVWKGRKSERMTNIKLPVVIVLKRSWPAVSQICNLIRLPSSSVIVLILKSMPMVLMKLGVKESSENLNNRQLLPTPNASKKI